MHHRCNHGQPVNFVQALYIIWVVSHQTKKYLNNCNNENCFFNKQKNQQQQRIKSNELRWSACETTTRQTKNVLNYCAFNFQYMVLIHSSHWRKKNTCTRATYDGYESATVNDFTDPTADCSHSAKLIVQFNVTPIEWNLAVQWCCDYHTISDRYLVCRYLLLFFFYFFKHKCTQ